MRFKIFAMVMLAVLCGSILFFPAFGENIEAGQKLDAGKTVLILGVDEAASNSDVVILARYCQDKNQLILMQLPRDMYFENDFKMPKLNHIYAAGRASGMDMKESLHYTSNCIANALDISIDGAICLELSSFSDMVDAIGGIPIDIPFDMTYQDPTQGLTISLKKGNTVLDGKAAAQFVRYRSGYVTGDLGRLDAQKLFLAATAKHILQNAQIKTVFPMIWRLIQNSSFTGEVLDIFSFGSSILKNRQDVSILYSAIPGEAIYDDTHGTWYYVINKPATCDLLNHYFVSSRQLDLNTWDKNGVFFRAQENFLNIYSSAGIQYRIYTAEELTDINILIKD